MSTMGTMMVQPPTAPQGARPVALVTGAARRIGRALARALAEDGWAVAVHHRDSAAEAGAVVQEIAEIHGRVGGAVAVQADLADEGAVAALVPRATEALGPLTLLVNNASHFADDSLETMTRATWDAHIEPNLRAPLVLTQAFARQLPAGAPEGNVINILDQRVWKLTPRRLSYTLSKAALWTLTQTLAQALAPRIRVNGIGPGPVLRNDSQSEAYFARQQQATILGRGAEPGDIAAALRYLLAARSVTGQMIAVDGGQHLAWQTPDVWKVDE